jgi:lipid-binding SYLF domain-containing protein
LPPGAFAHVFRAGRGGALIETKNSHLLALDGPPQWQTDAQAPACSNCVIPFDFFIRRHHCRLCGLIFCDECTKRRSMMPLSWGEKDPQRVCADCHVALAPIQDELAEINANSLRGNEIAESSLWRYVNRPLNYSLGGEVRKASYAIQNLVDGVEALIEDDKMRAKLFLDSEALVFITVGKVAFGGGIKFGTGLLLNKLPGTELGWSAPCAVGLFGVTLGIIAGAEVTDVIIPLPTKQALEHFKKSWGMTMGGEAAFAFGPIGRTAAADAVGSGAGVNTATSISNSKGLYGGVSLDGSVIKTRKDINKKFYGRDYSVDEILNGSVACPPAAKPLYDKLAEYKRLVQHRAGNFFGDAADEGGLSSGTGGGGGFGRMSSAPPVTTAMPTGSRKQQPAQAAVEPAADPRAAAAGAAYGAYKMSTPAQKAAAWNAGTSAYNSATPAQRSAAFGAVQSGVAAAAAPDDIYV